MQDDKCVKIVECYKESVRDNDNTHRETSRTVLLNSSLFASLPRDSYSLLRVESVCCFCSVVVVLWLSKPTKFTRTLRRLLNRRIEQFVRRALRFLTSSCCISLSFRRGCLILTRLLRSLGYAQRIFSRQE